jgi:glycosyltransferase involved in cell wall biosynthesis
MKEVLIASFDMEIGGVERSLISMLNNFDYESNKVDLMLYSHTGDLMHLLPKQATLLEESSAFKTFRMPVSQMLKSGKLSLGLTRLLAKYKAGKTQTSEPGYRQMQFMWKYALPFLPQIKKKYDVAISYLWPHYTVAEKVEAKTKIAWIHTDFSTVETDVRMDVAMWNKFDYIMAVSEACKNAFIKKYPVLAGKVVVMENITAPAVVKELANEKINHPIINEPRFKIITVARLSHAKGIDQAVKALKLLKDKGYDDIVWYVAGYGGDEEMLRKLIHDNGLDESFILLGKKTNPYPFMKAADLYVQPSRYEGKAVTVGEAQILAKPVLITNYPTAQSQVRQGVDGIICELSEKGIAKEITHMYNNPELRKRLSDNCQGTDYRNQEELEKLYALVQEGG